MYVLTDSERYVILTFVGTYDLFGIDHLALCVMLASYHAIPPLLVGD